MFTISTTKANKTKKNKGFKKICSKESLAEAFSRRNVMIVSTLDGFFLRNLSIAGEWQPSTVTGVEVKFQAALAKD